MRHGFEHLLRAFPLLLITGLLVSCLNPQPQAPRLLAHAQRLMEDHPDSAMLLIDSIFYPEESLSKKAYMDYLVTRVQARYKNYRPVAEDTLLFTARDYFARKGKDPAQTALAFFYSGCVYREQEDFDKAMEQYIIAEEYAAKTNDMDLQGLVQYNMGDLLSEQGVYAQALEKYKSAESLYRQSPLHIEEKRAKCLATIGRMFLLEGEKDSCFAALPEGLELAQTSWNRELQSLLAQNLSVSYREGEQYNKAEEYLRQSFALNTDTSDLRRYYLNFAKLYTETGRTDSARHYIQLLKTEIETSDDLFLKASSYGFLATASQANGNFNEAFHYQEKRSVLVEEITEKRLGMSVYEVQQKYDYEKQQNIHNRALLKRQKLNTLLLSLFLVVSLVSIGLLRRTLRQKDKLLSLQNALQTLNKTANDLRHQQDVTKESSVQLRETLLWKFDVQHKAALLKSELQHLERMDTKKAFARFYDIVYGKDNPSQWNTLVETIDAIHPGLSTFIRQNYPQFSDTEFNVCLLSYAGLNAKEAALILNQSPHTVNMARTRIRQKMNLPEPGADFCAVLEKSYRGG